MGTKRRNRIERKASWHKTLSALFFLALLALVTGCSSSSDTQSAVRESESFGITASITSPSSNVTIAPGDSVTFSANASGGSGTYTFNWDTPGGDVPNVTGSPSTPVTYSNEGVYTVTLSAVDERGNTARDAVNVTVSQSALGRLVAQITSPASSITIRPGESVTFTGQAIGGSGSETLSWSIPGANTPSATGSPVTAQFDNNGNFTVTLTATDSLGNQASDSVRVTVTSVVSTLVARITAPASNITVTSNTTAVAAGATAGDTVNFEGLATGGTGTGTYSYSWVFPGSNTATSTANPPSGVIFTNPGTYTVIFTVTDSAGRTASDTVTVTAN